MAKAAPQAFERFAQQFHQDVPTMYANLEEVVVDAIEVLTPAEQAELVTYIDTQLAQPVSLFRLAQEWSNSGSDLFLKGRGVQKVLTLARGVIKARAATGSAST